MRNNHPMCQRQVLLDSFAASRLWPHAARLFGTPLVAPRSAAGGRSNSTLGLVPSDRWLTGGCVARALTQMGCGGSKPEESGGGGDAIGTEQVDLSVNKEKRMSMTKRRVAVRCVAFARPRGRPGRNPRPHPRPPSPFACPHSLFASSFCRRQCGYGRVRSWPG